MKSPLVKAAVGWFSAYTGHIVVGAVITAISAASVIAWNWLNLTFEPVPPAAFFLLIVFLIGGLVIQYLWKRSAAARMKKTLEESSRKIEKATRSTVSSGIAKQVMHKTENESITMRLTYPNGLDVSKNSERIKADPFCTLHQMRLSEREGSRGTVYSCPACPGTKTERGDRILKRIFADSEIKPLKAQAVSMFVRTWKPEPMFVPDDGFRHGESFIDGVID